MATYELTAPNGAKYRVTAPDEATQDEVLSRVKAQSVADDMQNMSGGQVALSALKNTPSSAVDFVKNTVQPFIHPIETAENIGSLGKGVMQKLGILSGKDAEPYADAVGQFLKDRYGSLQAIKKTIATDPVGLAADISMVLTAGSSAAIRAPGAIGETAKAVGTAARAVDPVVGAGKVLKAAGGVAANALGVTTGVGSDALRVAARAGAEGGQAAKAFREGLSGGDMSEVVNEAKAAVGQLRQERGVAYRQAMADIGADQTILDFKKIDNAIASVEGVQKYKGQDLSPSTQKIRQQITDAVEEWRGLPAGDFHTAEGLDALKKKIGDIRDATQYGTPERVVADSVYKSIRQTIIDQAPEYAKAMKGYEEASDIIQEIEKTLSLKPGANVDTSLRKLQSVLRNNVSTNYGRRAELIDFLKRAGAPHLMEKIAGQTLSSGAPRGLSRLLAGGEGIGALSALMAGNPMAAAALVGGLGASSPALVGGAAHALGASTRLPVRPLGRSAFQTGRLSFANQ